MTELLPINIHVNDVLEQRFIKLKSISNKLAAQFNFRTMTASWYGDENEILNINLFLTSIDSFIQQKNDLEKDNLLKNKEIRLTTHSDDVVSLFNAQLFNIDCIIAITEKEEQLLIAQPKLLMSYVDKKLTKILNLIAKQQALNLI